MHITFVKKVTEHGDVCAKCVQVEQLLREEGYWDCIDAVLIADERIEDSAGVRLATSLGIEKSPLFVVNYDDGGLKVYTIYLKFVAQILEQLEHELPVYAAACA